MDGWAKEWIECWEQREFTTLVKSLHARLEVEPTSEEVRAVLDALASRDSRAAALMPIGPTLESIAIHGYLLASHKPLEGAVVLLQTLLVDPALPYIAWLDLERLSDEELKRLVAHQLFPLRARFARSIAQLRDEPEHALRLARTLRARLPGLPQATIVVADWLEALGQERDALDALMSIEIADPTILARRAEFFLDHDDHNAAASTIAMLRGHSDQDAIGLGLEWSILTGDFDTARALLHLLGMTDHHRNHALFARVILDDSGEAWDALADAARRGDHTARRLSLRLLRNSYVYALPLCREASVDALREAIASVAGWDRGATSESKPASIELTMSALESPSALIAFRLAMEKFGQFVTLKLRVEQVQEPDPRACAPNIDAFLWRRDGALLAPALLCNDAGLMNEIAKIAQHEFHLVAWGQASAVLARSLREADVPELIAMLVSPPPLPDQWDAFRWVQHVQVAVMMVLSAMLGTAMPLAWAESPVRAALLGLVGGPLDWTSASAALVCGLVGAQIEGARDEIVKHLEQLLVRLPTAGFTFIEHAIVRGAGPLLAAFEVERDSSHGRLISWENGEDGETSRTTSEART